MFKYLRFLFQLARAQHIARRYFVTNGFDGVLAMLGLMMGFYVSGESETRVMLSASLGTAVALFMSGLTSAYISESAERQRELQELEHSMVTSLEESAHGVSARLTPIFIALVNGLSPLFFSLLIMSPLWLADTGLPSLPMAVGIALLLTFLLGVFLGHMSGRFWLWTGLRALLIAVVTSMIILLLHSFYD